MSKKTAAAKSLNLEGNSGGDFLEITVLPDSLVSIRVGHCCVATDTKVIPVELLTATLFPIISGDWRTAIDAIAWPKDFKDELKNKGQLTLVVSQLDPDGVEATEIGRYAITPATWGQLQRTFPERLPSDTPDSVWLDIYEGDDLRDETIIVAHHHGVWLLRDWMKPPSSRWKRIRTPNG